MSLLILLLLPFYLGFICSLLTHDHPRTPGTGTETMFSLNHAKPWAAAATSLTPYL